jgi:hypothetical protein
MRRRCVLVLVRFRFRFRFKVRVTVGKKKNKDFFVQIPFFYRRVSWRFGLGGANGRKHTPLCAYSKHKEI